MPSWRMHFIHYVQWEDRRMWQNPPMRWNHTCGNVTMSSTTIYRIPFRRKNAASRILNAFIEALNDNKKSMPRMIIFLPDFELLSMLKYYDYGVSLMIGKIMHWLTNQVNRLLDARKEAFLHRKPGAIQDLEPKVFWMKMLPMPAGRSLDVIRAKFNAILEQTLIQLHAGFLLPASMDDSNFQRNWFDRKRNMTHNGRVEFWQFFNANLKRFDNQELNFEPRSQHYEKCSNNSNSRGSQVQQHSRLDLKTSYHQFGRNR